MARIIVSTGRGGVGKTAFTAIAAKLLVGRRPLLLIDADADENLAEAVGADYRTEDVRSVSEVLLGILRKDEEEVPGPLWERIKLRFYREALFEGEGFDLFTLGSKWHPGCYCAPNDALRHIIGELAEKYEYVLVDSPAGLEHLSRQVSSRVDDIFEILDPSAKSWANAKRAYEIIRGIGIKFQNFYLVSNWQCKREPPGEPLSGEGVSHVGQISYDEAVQSAMEKGSSLFTLQPDSPAYQSVRGILVRAGYLAA